MLAAATSARAVTRIPPTCADRLAPRLCAIHYHHGRVNVLRRRIGLRPIKYEWLAERHPARRARILTYWVAMHKHTSRRYASWLRHQSATPWSQAWYSDALCVHSHEGTWNAYNPAGPYYGGMQMDANFESTYGPEFVARYGDARHWPPHDQLLASYRAWRLHGWEPWPNTAAMCGLL